MMAFRKVANRHNTRDAAILTRRYHGISTFSMYRHGVLWIVREVWNEK